MTRAERIIVAVMLPVCILLAAFSAGLFWFLWQGFRGRLEEPLGTDMYVPIIAFAVACAVPLLLCLALLVMDWRRHQPKAQGMCPECGYDMRGSFQSMVCPECGKSIDGAH
jgi:hypothetical protein